MLQDIPTPTPLLRETRPFVLETERLSLRKPTLADVKAIASASETVFLIEHNHAPVGVAGVDWSEPDAPELGYWFGVDHWGRGFATEAARAVIDYTFEEFSVDQMISGARVVNPKSRNVLEKCGFQWSGVELHRFMALGSSTPVDRFRLSRGVWSSLKHWGNAARRER
jgi:RimJ/RimL family protein N-acetyltransferase